MKDLYDDFIEQALSKSAICPGNTLHPYLAHKCAEEAKEIAEKLQSGVIPLERKDIEISTAASVMEAYLIRRILRGAVVHLLEAAIEQELNAIEVEENEK